MLIQRYKEAGFLFNVNLTGKVGDAEVYRGDLVLVLGEVTERGDRMPPVSVAKQAVIYAPEGKIKLLVAGLDRLEDLALMVENYLADCADDVQTLFFVHNIKSEMKVELGGLKATAVALDDGMIWNEALELLCIEKSDLKGQSAEEKIETLYNELKKANFKYPTLSWEEALTKTVAVQHTARGPV